MKIMPVNTFLIKINEQLVSCATYWPTLVSPTILYGLLSQILSKNKRLASGSSTFSSKLG